MFPADAGDGLDNNESWGRSSTQQALLISGNIDIRYYALRGNVESQLSRHVHLMELVTWNRYQ